MTYMMNELTDRQRDIKTRLDSGLMPRAIAEELGITRNAVYQAIQRMRRDGALPHDYTPSGQPPRTISAPGRDVLARLLNEDGNGEDANMSGALALYQELKRTRDDLDQIVRRLSLIVAR